MKMELNEKNNRTNIQDIDLNRFIECLEAEVKELRRRLDEIITKKEERIKEYEEYLIAEEKGNDI